MENKKNYQLEMEKVIAQAKREGDVPTLFLHSCCAPCSSYVLEYLSEYFKITVFYYNPNIYPRDEYEERLGEIRRLVGRCRRAILWNLWRVITGRRNFFRWRRDMRKTKRGANAVPYALECGFMRRQSWPKRGDLTGSRQPSPSVR